MTKLLTFLLIISFGVSSSFLIAQDKHKVDSLRQELKTRAKDTNRVKILIELGNLAALSQKDSAILYYEDAMATAEEIESKYFQAKTLKQLASLQRSHKNLAESNKTYLKAIDLFMETGHEIEVAYLHSDIGVNLKMMGFYTESRESFNKALVIFEKHEDNFNSLFLLKNIGITYMGTGYADTAIVLYNKALEMLRNEETNIKTKKTKVSLFMVLGTCYGMKGEYEKSLEILDKTLKLSIELEDKYRESLCYEKIGITYSQMGDYSTSIEYYYKSLAIDTVNNHVDKLAGTYYNMGAIFDRRQMPKEAKKYFSKALKEYQRMGNIDGQAASYCAIGGFLQKENNYDSALYYNQEAEKIYLANGNNYGLSIAQMNIAANLSLLKEFDQGIIYFEKCLKLHEERGDKKNIARAEENIAQLYIDKANESTKPSQKNEFLINAVKHAEKALKIALDIGALYEQKASYSRLSDAYEGLNEYKKSKEYFKEYIVIKDSIFSEKKKQTMLDMEDKYEAATKQLEIEKLEKEKELQEEKMNRQSFQRNASIVGFLLMLVLVLIVVRNLMNKKKANALLNTQKSEIEDKNKDLKELVDEVTKQKDEISTQKGITEKLQHIDKLKDDFLANTSHELRTPLTGIIGISESLFDGAAGKINAKIKENLSVIITSGKRLTNLVNDILDFSKMRNNDLILNPKPVGLKPMVDLVLMLSNPLLSGKNIEVKSSITTDLPPIHADENRLQQILFNLIGNAFKFTDEGKVSIDAKVKDKTVEISITDTGIGIPENKLKDIFLSFEQVDSSETRSYGGTGLGLSVSKNLIELHGGKIWVESEKGKGSKFTFTMPVSDGKPEVISTPKVLSKVQESESEESLTPIVTSGEFRILIVDDESVNQQVLSNHLNFANYSIKQVFNGADALKAIDEAEPQFDLILLDIMMPKMTGYEVCNAIREKFMPNELPVLMITAKNQLSDLVEGFSCGANDYIAKPFSKDELLVRIKTHLNLLKINSSYSRFVPGDFMKALNRDSIIDVKLGDHVEGEMTVLFSDIRSFTSISEGMTPEENFNFLNDYLKHCIPAIHQNDGFIDKYIGDAVMAIFPGNPKDAIRASVKMLKDLELYNLERQKNKQIPINIGIGIHTGALMLGTIGNEKRMDGTVISDAVNLASRLEGLTKIFGASIIISEFTLNGIKTKKDFNYRFLFRVLVKGKNKSVDVYEVFDGDTSMLFDLKQQTKSDYEKALQHYFAKEFSKALPLFETVIKQNPGDKASAIYLERLAKFIVNPVGDDWEGVETMDSK